MVRASDKKLVSAATRNLVSLNPVEKMHAALGATGIVGKMGLEEMGVMDELKFVDAEHADREEIQGEGKKKKKRKKRSDAKPKPKKDRVKRLRELFKKIEITKK